MTKKTQKQNREPDSLFVMKVVLYFVLGTMWITISSVKIGQADLTLPIGLLLGFYFAHHDHFQIDRKIEFAILFMAAVLSFALSIGFVLAF